MAERDYAPLSVACVRGLCDKLYEKRKFAGGEIEKMVKDFSDAKNTSQVKRLIKVLGQDLMSSTNPNVKNGALMGLSSVAVGLGQQGCVEYLSELIHPIVACFSESESRVRYQAVEALFNVVKIARGDSLEHFPLIFDALARLAADSEPQVKQAAEVLDRLVKDIVTESPRLEVGAVARLVRERMFSRSASARQFVVSWVAVLDAVPDLRLLPHLPDLLDGLFKMLDDPNTEIRRMCDIQLTEFLRSIKKDPSSVDFQAMINVLIVHAQSPEELLQLTAITWIKEFVELSGEAMLPYASGILAAILPCLAYADEPRKSIRETAATVNLQMSRLACGAAGERLALAALVAVLTQMLLRPAVHTKVAALDWILHLYNKLPQQMFLETDGVFPCVVGSLTDAADDVVRRALAVLAEICECAPHAHSAPADTTPADTASADTVTADIASADNASADTASADIASADNASADIASADIASADTAPADTASADTAPSKGGTRTVDLESSPYYYKFLKALLRLLAADENLLEDRGAFIIRQLCVLLNAEDIYKALSKILLQEKNLKFVSTMVDVLNTILLTSAELYDLRLQLRHFNKPATHSLFVDLYECWCHSPVSLLALCLLTHNYSHCNTLISTFGDLEITVDFLTEVDKLVQLIESPIFAYLRLELLEGGGELRRALFGLLMLLPQSDAFHALRRRLQCAPHGAEGRAAGGGRELPAAQLAALRARFARVSAERRHYMLRERARPDRAHHY